MNWEKDRRRVALGVPGVDNSRDRIDLAFCWLEPRGLRKEMLSGGCEGQTAFLPEKATSLCVLDCGGLNCL